MLFGASIHQVIFQFNAGEFEKSMMEELSYFLGLQIKQTREGTAISQAKYIKELLRKYDITGAKVAKTPMITSAKLD